jgi:hypothetical protein
MSEETIAQPVPTGQHDGPTGQHDLVDLPNGQHDVIGLPDGQHDGTPTGTDGEDGQHDQPVPGPGGN